MRQKQQPLKHLNPDAPPPLGRRHQHRHDAPVERTVVRVARVQPLVHGLLQEGVERGALSRRRAGRVEDVERHVQEVRHQVHVALGTAASRLARETLVL